MAIVGDLEQFEPAFLDQDFDGRGARVDGIFEQFLERVHGSHDDLAGGDLVDDILIQSLESSQ